MIDFLVFLYFTFSSIFFTWPLILNLTRKITGIYDELLITWIINWVIHALTTNPLSLFQANIFYPYKNTLAYSDIHLANALFVLPLIKLFKEPVLAFNINLLAGFVLTGFATYLLVKYLTKNPLAGIISGTLSTFSTIHLNYLGHLQLFCLQYFILAVFFCYRFLDKKSFKNFLLFLIASVLATLNNFLIGYFLVFSVLIIWIIREISKMRWFLLWGILLLAICSPFFIPYFKVSREFNYTRPIQDAIHFSLQPEDLIYPSNMTRIENFLLDTFKLRSTASWMKTTPGYLGLAFYLLGAWAVIMVIRRIGEIRKGREKNLLILVIIGLIGLILAFGPAMHWQRRTIHKPFIIPLPYAILYYLLPGFSGFRTPSRWILLFAFALSVLIGIIFNKVFKKAKSRGLLTIFTCSLIFLEFNFPLTFYSVPKRKDYPKVYYYLDKLDKNAPVLEMPILNWDAYELVSIETKRELYSTLNFRKMVNGFSGFTPPEREILMKKIMLEFPSPELNNWLKEIKVKYIILHKKDDELLEKNNFLINGKKIKNFEEVISLLEKYSQDFFLIKKIESSYIYEVKG